MGVNVTIENYKSDNVMYYYEEKGLFLYKKIPLNQNGFCTMLLKF